MTKNLVIVESPAKAKTIEKYLGKDFQVLASYGHVRDLIPKEGAVDPNNDFAMKYEVIDRNQKHVQAISAALKNADVLYLATDPDREGEAISWHLYELLKAKKLLKDKPVHRVVFHEITKKAVTEAIANPESLAINLINAQQARRALDYLVGFNLSPLLWKKIRRGLSAGRVQSPALRMIVERELEIEAFKSREYWTIDAVLNADEQVFKAKLTHLNGEKLTQFKINSETLAEQAKQTLLAAANGQLIVSKQEKKQQKRQPAPPFITSTLQQEASRKLGFTTKRTMSVAQQLYEGIDVGGETAGLITYMRTDSVNLAIEAVTELRELIAENYGKENVPKEPRVFKTKSKNAQEAHEAIRPTYPRYTPSQIKQYLSAEQFKLYELIWKRTVACQMLHATLNSVSIDLSCADGQHIFRATGSSIANAGFMTVYLEGKDDSKEGDDKESFLPDLTEGRLVPLQDILTGQHFTEPPPRYGEASLVKSLEEHGIGRPSTYSAIISTLQNREYVTLDSKRFYPTDVGRIVNKFLTEHFTKYVDYDFTANLEDDLDAVSRGEKDWIPLMHDFWKPFTSLIQEKETSVQRKDVTQEAIDEVCPECGKPLSIRLGRNGRFIGCTNYPDCSYTRNLDDSANSEPETVTDRVCPLCASTLVFKAGKYGKFIGCSAYPKCRHIEPIEKPTDTGVQCPQCKKGNILKRKSGKGKIFYSCANYPKCDYALWNAPIKESCPECQWPILTVKETKRRGVEKVCPQKDCKYATPYEGEPMDAQVQVGDKEKEIVKRLNPTYATLRELFLLSRNECAFKGCNQKMVDDERHYIGKICHIEAANFGGERFNPNQTNEERRHISNLLLMCGTHHDITNNVSIYSVSEMKKIKADHEKLPCKLPISPNNVVDDFVDHSLNDSITLPNNFKRLDISDCDEGFFSEAKKIIQRFASLPRLTRKFYAHALRYSHIADLSISFNLRELEIRLQKDLNTFDPHIEILQHYGFLSEVNNEDYPTLRCWFIGQDDEIWFLQLLKKYCDDKPSVLIDIIENLNFILLDE